MVALLSLLVVLVVSHLAIRAGAAALALTGIAEEAARFQAQSAFLGVGFTTRESEQVLDHPVRRRIVMLLMLLGNAGVAASISSVVLVFVTGANGESEWTRAVALVGAVTALWIVGRSAVVDRNLTRAVRWALRRWTRLDVRDYVRLLHLTGDFAIVELEVRPGTWLAGRTLAELDLRSEGLLVLGIERPGGAYLGVPRGPTRLLVADVLLVYGIAGLLEDLDHRPVGDAGDRAHAAAMERQMRRLGLRVPSVTAIARR
ncbi:TrkA-C domain protein (plasmid) [Gemmatirosa kalamazoonensis]|uniref:TrkA-C domain protein n=1 Tax=Gemmatirosa kalamazoonensis TaxID=861299 RepID=W0RQ35_9BACT|nr:TrkA C-terminal domain-containing protein [Gemmatirosa kalamazoonensis]AHG92592.1 TrkA-C domain protein [Gemmatirosa kalamazoonensis]